MQRRSDVKKKVGSRGALAMSLCLGSASHGTVGRRCRQLHNAAGLFQETAIEEARDRAHDIERILNPCAGCSGRGMLR